MYYLIDIENPDMTRKIRLHHLSNNGKMMVNHKMINEFAGDVIEIVCEVFRMSKNDIINSPDISCNSIIGYGDLTFNKIEVLSDSRKRPLIMARQTIAYILRIFCQHKGPNRISLNRIGELIVIDGNNPKNHATVINAVRQVENTLETNFAPYSTIINQCIDKVSERWISYNPKK